MKNKSESFEVKILKINHNILMVPNFVPQIFLDSRLFRDNKIFIVMRFVQE